MLGACKPAQKPLGIVFSTALHQPNPLLWCLQASAEAVVDAQRKAAAFEDVNIEVGQVAGHF